MQQYHTDTERVESLIDSYREAIGGNKSENAKAIQDYIEAEEKKAYEAINVHTKAQIDEHIEIS